MTKAPATLLELIHAKLAQAMLDKLNDPETPAEAKDWAVIVKFLKDNNIDAIPTDAPGADEAFTKLMVAAQESIKQYQ